MTDAAPVAVAVRITGRVQGVWFRAWTRGEAKELGLAGWVRNEPDGTVRALFVGPQAEIGAMLARCRRGPPMAQVESVETVSVTPVPAVEGFRVER